MIRRTITLSDELASAVDAQVAAGEVSSVSAFVRDAVRNELRRRRDERVATEAAKLDADEEIALARGRDGGGPWRRLT